MVTRMWTFPRALIVASPSALQVVSRTGSFLLKGTGIDRAYGPALDYLSRHDSPRTAVETANAPLRPLLSQALRALARTGAFDDAPLEGRFATVERVTPAAVAKRLLALIPPVTGTYTILAVSDGVSPEQESLSEWLRTVVASQRDEGSVSVYRLRPNGVIDRTLYLQPDAQPRAIVDQLRVVEATSHAQLPLAVARASHPWLPISFTGYGISMARLAADLAARFVALNWLFQENLASVRFVCGELVDGAPHRRWVDAPWQECDGWSFHNSLSEARLGAAEDRATISELDDRHENSTVDLRSASFRDSLQYLRSIALDAFGATCLRLTRNGAGLYSCRLGAFSSRAFLREKAIGDTLLRAIWSRYYQDSVGSVPITPVTSYADFASQADVDSLAADVIRRVPIDHASARTVTCWGYDIVVLRREALR